MFALCGAMIVVGIAYIAVAPRPAPAEPVARAAAPATELAASATPVTTGGAPSIAKARSVALDSQAREAGAAKPVVAITPTVPSTAPPPTTPLPLAPATTVDPLTTAAVATASALVSTVDTVLATLAATAPTTVAPVVRVAGHSDAGVASWFHAPESTCAHRTLPRGTMVKVTRVSTGAVASCRVDDWGPTVATGRIIDLSMDTFAALAPTSAGLLDVTIEW
jgi:rare lipoprotein A